VFGRKKEPQGIGQYFVALTTDGPRCHLQVHQNEDLAAMTRAAVALIHSTFVSHRVAGTGYQTEWVGWLDKWTECEEHAERVILYREVNPQPAEPLIGSPTNVVTSAMGTAALAKGKEGWDLVTDCHADTEFIAQRHGLPTLFALLELAEADEMLTEINRQSMHFISGAHSNADFSNPNIIRGLPGLILPTAIDLAEASTVQFNLDD